MSKTPFRMPQRAESPRAELDHWVAGGERPAAAPEGALRHERAGAKVARLTIDLPPALHARFKATCALRGTRMIDEVRQLIEDWTQKNV
jgi:ParG